MRKVSQIVLAAGLIGGSALPAHAQTAQDSGKSEAAEDFSGVQEIIVRASRRNERMQDVPVSVTALNSDALESSGASNTIALESTVPGLQFQQAASFGGAPYVRGVGTQQVIGGSEASTAIYIDDVYISASSANLMSLANIEQVEVLKGPQGTLFGRNATGGVIHIRTKRPSHETSGYAEVGYGNFDTYSGKFYATTGLSQTVAISIAAAGDKQRSGWGRNTNTGEPLHLGGQYAVRGQLLWEPDAATSALLSVDISGSNKDTAANPALLPGSIGAIPGFDVYDSTSGTPDLYRTRQKGVSLRLEHDLGAARLISISALRRSLFRITLDQDRTAANIVQAALNNPAKTFSQELQLQSPEGSDIRWLLGAYYFRNKSEVDLSITGAAFGAFGGGVLRPTDQTTNSYAVFADATVPLGPDTKLTGGIRYTRDKIDLDYKIIGLNTATGVQTDLTALPLAAVFCALCVTPGVQKDRVSKVTFRAVLDHHFTPDVMAYASFSRGFHTGGWSATNANFPVVKPEVVDAYEVGLKTDLFDRRLRFNTSGFYYDYSNLQVVQVVTGGNIQVNAAAARIYGLEATIDAAPTRNLRLNAGVSVLDTKFTSFPGGPFLFPTSQVPIPTVCNPALPVTPLTPPTPYRSCGAFDLAGNELTNAPDFTFNFGASYTFELGDAGNLELSGNFYHNSGIFWTTDNNYGVPSYETVNLALKWTSADEHLSARLWVNNVTDKLYYQSITASTAGIVASPAAPRTYGATVGFRF